MAQRETDWEFADEPAGYVGAHEAVVGEDTDATSINVPQIRPGASRRAREGQEARKPDETFVAATHRDESGDVLDVTGEAESKAVRRRAEAASPEEATEDAMETDLRGQTGGTP
jgi:hypothetical protein